MTDERPLADLVNELRADHRRRWMEGDRVAIEDFFERNPRLCADSERALEFVYGEILLREELGESPDWEDYARRFPDLAERLTALLEVHRALESGCLLDLTDAESPGRADGVGGRPAPGGPSPGGWTATRSWGSWAAAGWAWSTGRGMSASIARSRSR